MGRKSGGMGDHTMMTIDRGVGLWPTYRVIVSIQAVCTQKNLLIIADGGFRKMMLVRTSDKMSAIE
jgi:hypothetical protein